MSSKGLTDIHCHVLPNVDDGSQNLTESIGILQAESTQGVSRVIATPHFYADRDTLQCFMARRHEAERVLRREMEQFTDLPELFLGAEVHYFSGISHWDDLEALTLNGSRYLLLEMPWSEWTNAMLDEAEEMAAKRDIIPILAHVERYFSPFRTKQVLDDLRRRSLLVQCNAEFFLQPNTVRTGLKYLREDRIHFMGSDSHNMTRRKPNMGDAAEIILDKLGNAPLERISEMSDLLFDS